MKTIKHCYKNKILFILISFLCVPVSSSSQSPIRNSEFLIDTSYASQPFAPGDQDSSAIAFDGTYYIVVWQDRRNGMDYSIFGARTTGDAPIDSFPFVVNGKLNDQKFPAIAFNGNHYLAVWEDNRNGINYDIYGTFINPNGTVIDTNGFLISTGPYAKSHPSVAGGNGNFIVVWQQVEAFNYIYGSINLGQPFIITHNTKPGEFPQVVFDGTNYFAVWQHYNNNTSSWNIYGSRINASGYVLDTLGIPICTVRRHKQYPTVTFNGQNYLVVWQEHNISLDSIYLFGSRVTRGGIVLDTGGFAIDTQRLNRPYAKVSSNYRFPNIGDYLAIWQENGARIRGARIDSSGIVLDSSGIDISPPLSVYNTNPYPSVCFGDSDYFITWDEKNENDRDVKGISFSPLGYPLDSVEFTVSRGIGYDQTDPCIAYDGTNYLAIWIDYSIQRWAYWFYGDLKGIRINDHGEILDRKPIMIKSADWFNFPKVIFGDSNFFVIWKQDLNTRYIWGARINREGTLIDTNGILLSNSSTEPAFPGISFDDTNYFVTWGFNNALKEMRINTDGIIIDTGFISIPDVNTVGSSVAAFDDTNYLTLWESREWHSWLTYYDLFGARTSTSGSVIDTIPIDIDPDNSHYEKNPALAYGGMNYLVVWQDSSISRIYGTRIDPSGAILDPGRINISVHQSVNPAVSYDGTNYFTAWQDYDNHLHGARVSPTTGFIIDTFIISNQPGFQLSPALAHGRGDQIMIVYPGWVDYYNNRYFKLQRIWGKLYPFIGITENTSAVTNIDAAEPRIYPNPVHNDFTVYYITHKPGSVRITLYDITGRLIKIISTDYESPGSYNKKSTLHGIANGIYFLKIDSDNGSKVIKIIHIK